MEVWSQYVLYYTVWMNDKTLDRQFERRVEQPTNRLRPAQLYSLYLDIPA